MKLINEEQMAQISGAIAIFDFDGNDITDKVYYDLYPEHKGKPYVFASAVVPKGKLPVFAAK